MTKENEKRVDSLVGSLLTQFEGMIDELSFSQQLDLANTIKALEEAKAVGNPAVLNWGTVNVHQATDNGEISNTYTNGGKNNGT